MSRSVAIALGAGALTAFIAGLWFPVWVGPVAGVAVMLVVAWRLDRTGGADRTDLGHVSDRTLRRYEREADG